MKNRYSILIAILLLLGAANLNAQTTDALGTYTPYSLYGIGDLANPTTTISKSMGGIGIGVRELRNINLNNIAAVTERDTLAFMADVGVISKNVYLKDKNGHSGYNAFNINNLALSFPITGSGAAMLVGIAPFSNIGYKFQNTESDPSIISRYGDIKYRKYGEGSISQVFAGIAVNPFNNFSIGVQGIYYFGNLRNNSNVVFNTEPSVRSIETGWQYRPNGFSAEVGAQYTYKASNDYTYVFGATYRMRSKLKGSMDRFANAVDNAAVDTVYLKKERFHQTIPASLGVGFSIRHADNLMFGFDYQRQDWSKATFRNSPGIEFYAQTAQSFKVGIEWVPNRYDIRYMFKRLSYRAGFHYDQSYVKLDGNSINTTGFTFGVSVPVYRLSNTLNFAVDFGQRGTKKGNLVRERYVNFIFSFSLHDIWFIKPKYQ